MKKAQYFYLLRRGFFSGGGLDSDYQAVLDQATTQGFTAPSDTQQNLQSNIIKTLKAYGVWGPKKFMGKEYDGINRTTFVIDKDGIIKDIITNVKTKAHTSQILGPK